MNNVQRRSLIQVLDAVPGATMASASTLVPSKGWLRAVREALGLTQSQMAKNLGMKQQAYANTEVREQKEKITLSTLRRAAGALDCDLVYALVPRKAVGSSFSELAAKQDPHYSMLRATEHSMALEGQGRARIAKE